MNADSGSQKDEAAPSQAGAETDPIVPHLMRWKWLYLGAGALALAFMTLNSSGQTDTRFANRRLAIIMSDHSTMPLKHTVQTIVDRCTTAGTRLPTWEWSPLRWGEQTLRCYSLNKQNNFPMTIDWQFKDIGKDASGTPYLLLSGVVIDGTSYEGKLAPHALFSVVPSIAESYLR